MITRILPSSTGGRARLATAVTLASAAAGLLLATPAAGDENKNVFLQLSHDGVHYTTTLASTLFRSSNGYVPGESRRDTIWVRNGGTDTAHLSFGVRNAGPATGSALSGYMRLQANAPGHEEVLATLPSNGACTPVINGWTLAVGQVIPLTLDLGLTLRAPNSTRNQESTFDLVFVLQEIDGGSPVSPCASAPKVSPEDASIGVRPVTGNTAPQGPQDSWPVAELPHSNVVANSRSPWPWLLTLSASAYTLISFRRRRRTR